MRTPEPARSSSPPMLVLVATTLFVLFPYAWMLVTSIKPIADVVAWPVRWLPRDRHARELRGDPRRRALPALALQQRGRLGRRDGDQPRALGAGGLRADPARARRRPADAGRHPGVAVLPADGVLRSLLHHAAVGRAAEHAAGPDLRLPLGHAADLHLDGRDVAARHSGRDRGGGAHRRLRRLAHHPRHRPADRHARDRHRRRSSPSSCRGRSTSSPCSTRRRSGRRRRRC